MPSRSAITDGSIVSGTSLRVRLSADEAAVGDTPARRTAARRRTAAARRARPACFLALPSAGFAGGEAAVGTPYSSFSSSHVSQISGRLGSPSPVTNTSMNGASGSGFCAHGPPAMHQRIGRRPRSSDRSGMPPRSSIVRMLRVADLVLQREAEHVELGQRRERLQAVERQSRARAAAASMSVQGVKARSQAQSGRGVHQRVEHLQAVVAHADGVGVGKRQAELAADLRDGPCGPCSARPPHTGPAT